MHHRPSRKRALTCAVLAVFVVVIGNLCILGWLRHRGVGNEPSSPGPVSTSSFESFGDRGPDPATSQDRAKALAVVFDTGSPAAVANLLAANGYENGSVEKIGHSARRAPDKATKVQNTNADLVAIPVRMTMKLPPGMNDPRMAPKSDAVFLFDEQGNLRYRLGGGRAADSLNGDMGTLLSLGTESGLFFWVTRFEAFHGFKMVSEFHMVQPNVRRVLRVYHFPRDPICPAPGLPEPAKGVAGVGFRGQQPLENAIGIGADGQDHSNWLLWDAEKQVFTGASRLRHGDLPAFQFDLTQSEGFVPTDLEQ